MKPPMYIITNVFEQFSSMCILFDGWIQILFCLSDNQFLLDCYSLTELHLLRLRSKTWKDKIFIEIS